MNSIQQIIYFFEIFIMLTNPLESLNLIDYDEKSMALQFNEENYFIASDDGIIDDIIINVNNFLIIISYNTLGKVVYSGLSDIKKAKGENIYKGEIIGKDVTITENTKFILMLFENLNQYPQFFNNELTFDVPQGTPVYSVYDAYLIEVGYYAQTLGLYQAYSLKNKEIIIRYQYLMRLINQDSLVKQGELIVYSGFTGNILLPQLTININGSMLDDEIKVIYWNPKKTIN